MRLFLARRWFLLALLVGVVFCGYFPDAGRFVFGWLPARVVVGAALLLIAVGLDGRELSRSILRPWPTLWGVVVSYGVVPPLAILAGTLLPTADYRVGLLLIASSPCTLASAVIWTRRAGGHEATALLVVVLTTATGWLVTPLWLTLAGGVEWDVTAMMLDLLLVLLVPVGLGQVLRLIQPLARCVDRGKAGLGVVSQVLVLGVLLKGTSEAARSLRASLSLDDIAMLSAAAGLSVAVHVAAVAAGWFGAAWFGFDRPSRTAVAFAGSQKSIPVALLLFERYLQAAYPLALVPVVCYHVGQLVVDTLIADWLSDHGPRTNPGGR